MTEPNNKHENLPETKNKYLNNLDVDYNVQEYKQSGTTKKRERAKPGYFLSFPLNLTLVLIILVNSIILLFGIPNIFREPKINFLQNQTDCRVFITVIKTDGQPLSEVKADFLSSHYKDSTKKNQTDAEGKLNIELTMNHQIDILISKEGFKPKILTLKTDVKEISKIIMLEQRN